MPTRTAALSWARGGATAASNALVGACDTKVCARIARPAHTPHRLRRLAASPGLVSACHTHTRPTHPHTTSPPTMRRPSPCHTPAPCDTPSPCHTPSPSDARSASGASRVTGCPWSPKGVYTYSTGRWRVLSCACERKGPALGSKRGGRRGRGGGDLAAISGRATLTYVSGARGGREERSTFSRVGCSHDLFFVRGPGVRGRRGDKSIVAERECTAAGSRSDSHTRDTRPCTAVR